MKHYFILLAAILAMPIAASAQDDGWPKVQKTQELILTEAPEKMSDDRIFDVVEQMPSFPEMEFTRTINFETGQVEKYKLSGFDAFKVWLSKNVHYPPVAEENGVQGTVLCSFIVECDGSISTVNLARGVDPSLNKEAVRVVKSMPKWVPGKQNGKAVRVKYTVPITFKLQ